MSDAADIIEQINTLSVEIHEKYLNGAERPKYLLRRRCVCAEPNCKGVHLACAPDAEKPWGICLTCTGAVFFEKTAE